MFLLSDDLIELTPVERDAAKAFLESKEGRRMLAAWLALRPGHLLKGTSEEIIAAAGAVAGYESAVTILMELSRALPNDKPDTKGETYPDLENDKNWPENPAPIDSAPADATAI